MAQEDAAERRAALALNVATDYVAQAINRTPHVPMREALGDPLLSQRFRRLIAVSNELFEIAVVDPTGQILADSNDGRIGMYTSAYPEYDTLVHHSSLLLKAKMLRGTLKQQYQMEMALGRGREPLVYVRVVVWPVLILTQIIWPWMHHSAENAILLFAGAIGLIFLDLVIAFRRLG